ncbi:serine hydrolase domain-containing protein [Kibdelosporangium phytohabitans]|uniref:Penicillin-binding protein n=1 Tax=Kibdelosporangium phytohabitans TaxID=860235 RepID=A0A0N9HUH5_9PSEU|nr:serine hydrolase domain-containing protein [Kibdelosporangium phytohabitans]ALG08638.1 penicillin-binding protein [Kibdelosporangium phytohabitans]MBE1470269.1 D-alanyl-D-alanine carboxypeptidase [Kibdelosporangium phytohabitans]
MKTILIGAVVALTSVLVAPTASAATPAQILQAGAELGVRDGYPGVIGLVRNGPNTQLVQAGLGDRFAGVPADATAKFRIGSNTKAFISTVLLQLESEGKLSLDDTVAKWLPNAVRANGHDGTKISVRQLLNHTSGLPEYAADARVSLPYIANTDPRQPWPPQSLVDIALTNVPVGAPGEKFNYANTNYVLAGMAIKAVTGDEPAAEVQRRIIEPLGLRDTTYPTADPEMPAKSLHGHFWVGNFLIRDVTSSNVQVYGPAGAMVSTVNDLAAFERALFSGQLLPPAQMAELKTTVPISGGGGYGLGVGYASTPCGGVWNHSGAVLGYFSMWLTSEDGSKQVVTAANEFHMIGGTKGQQDVGKAALDAYCAL